MTRRIFTFSSACAVVALLVAGPGGFPTGSTLPAAHAAEHESRLLARAIQFRTVFGLNADADFVQRTLAEPEAYSAAEWGVPLSADETADLAARLQVQEDVQDAITWANRQPDFAGQYFDQLRGGLPVFLFTSGTNEATSQIEKRVPDGLAFEVLTVATSLAQLTETKKAVSSDRKELLELGVELVSVSVDVRNNDVAVGVAATTGEVEQVILNRYSGVFVYSDAPHTIDACAIDGAGCSAPMKGGLEILRDSNVGDPPQGCTAGYTARRIDGSTNYPVIVTAGHCITYQVGSHSLFWNLGDDSTWIGTQSLSTETGWYDNSLGDVGYIKLSPTWAAGSPLNKALIRPDASPPALKNVTTTKSWSNQTVGTAVCRVGLGSWLDGHGRTCGTITMFDTDTTGTNVDSTSCVNNNTICKYIFNMKAVSFDSTGGDSGGIVTNNEGSSSNVQLFGTHVHSVPDGTGGVGPNHDEYGWYTTWDQGQEELSFNHGIVLLTCLNSACN